MASQTLHATTVAIDGYGVLILGASGAGKSSLALRLLALGATLVSDDRTIVTPEDGALIATAPIAITGLIEARGVGLLHVGAAGPTPLILAIDLDQPEPARLPPHHIYKLMGHDLPCLHNADSSHFPAAVLLYVRSIMRAAT